MDKGQRSMESERKAYCEEFKNHLVKYIADESIHSKTYVSSIQGIIAKLDELNTAYLTAIKHMTDVSMPALGYLTKRFDVLKKSIKVGSKTSPADLGKIRDFEYERLDNIKHALLHFFNAKMYLHAKALELYSAAYEILRQISVRAEFK